MTTELFEKPETKPKQRAQEPHKFEGVLIGKPSDSCRGIVSLYQKITNKPGPAEPLIRQKIPSRNPGRKRDVFVGDEIGIEDDMSQVCPRGYTFAFADVGLSFGLYLMSHPGIALTIKSPVRMVCMDPFESRDREWVHVSWLPVGGMKILEIELIPSVGGKPNLRSPFRPLLVCPVR